MTKFPTSPGAFYALRDDRTSRCCSDSAYQRVACAVHVSPEVASTAVGQTMVMVTCNLLSRWCRRVVLVLPETMVHPLLSMGNGDLGAMILAQMRDADPFGDFDVHHPGSTTAATVTLSLGAGRPATVSPGTVFINASGWLASLSRCRLIGLPHATEDNLLGGIAAACLGVAQAFKIAIGIPDDRLLRDGVFDLFRLTWSRSTDPRQGPWPSIRDVGKVLMVGAGSVGSSAAYCMRFANLSGELDVLDGDKVKIENFNRSPVFGRGTFGLAKVDAVSAHLNGTRLAATAMPIWWNEAIRERGRAVLDHDVWLPLANDFNVRHAMQQNLPPLMIHASTSQNWGVNHGRHIPGKDDCLIDRFPQEPSSESLACSVGQVETSGVSIDAALPFASVFAGLLVAADLTRAQLPGYPHVPNFAAFDWYGSFGQIQSWDWKPRPGCVCQGQPSAFYAKLIGGTKYRALFPF